MDPEINTFGQHTLVAEIVAARSTLVPEVRIDTHSPSEDHKMMRSARKVLAAVVETCPPKKCDEKRAGQYYLVVPAHYGEKKEKRPGLVLSRLSTTQDNTQE
jgi:hypothetical protein